MSTSASLKKLCEPILQMNASSRIKAIELILHSLDEETREKKPDENYSMQDVFAAWDSDESPEETARQLRQSRCFNREREEL